MSSTMSLDSPFSEKLRKNHIAQPEEEAGIRAVIEHHRTIVRELDVQQKDIDQAIMALIRQKKAVRGIRDTHQKFIDDHQSLLSSVLHLPEDVLSKIFMESVPLEDQWPRIHPIVQISHVCRQWRDSALSNPMLWSALEVNNISLPKPRPRSEPDLQQFERRMRRLADMFSVLLSRAAGSPMTLSMRAEDPTAQHAMPAYGRSVLPVITVLRQNRWETTRLHLTPRHPDSPLLQLLQFDPRSYQSLRDLVIICSPESGSRVPGIVGHLNLHDLEQLSVLHLDLGHVNPLDIRIRWKTLTEIHLYTTLLAVDALRLMAQCPNLTRLTVGIFDTHPSSQSLYPPRSVTMPCLRSLRLIGETEGVLQSLVLPALSTFQIMEMSNHRLESAVPQWFRTYGAQLKRVAFNYDCIDVPALLSCFKYLSGAVSLEVGPSPKPADRDGGNEGEALSVAHRTILGALTVKRDDTGALIPVCPKLENLIVHAPDLKTEIGEWAELFASRRGSLQGAPTFLKAAQIRLPDPGYAEQVTVLSRYSGVYGELARRGVSTNRIEFLLEKDVRWADY